MTVSDLETARRPHRVRTAVIVLLFLGGVVAGTALTRPGVGTAGRVRDIVEYVAGVFALLGLTEAVMSGVVAAERLVPVRFRLLIQSTHRATGVIAAGFLVVHVVLKIAEAHARVLDAVLPFAGGHVGRARYVGLGTIASDLLIVVLATGFVRGRFAGTERPWAWRSVHAAGYVVWPLALVHGLLAGRAPKWWVVAGYLAAVAVVLLAVASRLPRLLHERRLVVGRLPGRQPPAPDPAFPYAEGPVTGIDPAFPEQLRTPHTGGMGDRR